MQFAPSRAAVGVDSAASTIAGKCRNSSPCPTQLVDSWLTENTNHTAVVELGALDSQNAIWMAFVNKGKLDLNRSTNHFAHDY